MQVILKKTILVFFLVFGFTAPGTMTRAEDILPARPTNVDRIYVIPPPSTESSKPVVYDLKRWVVEEKADPVKHALEVYKKKSEPSYNHRIWLTSKADGKKHLVVEYASRGAGDKVLFSPNEDFMYYLGLTPAGGNIIYGVDLSSDQKFTLGAGEDFRTVNCPNKNNYVVVQQQDGQRTVYQVYSITGQRMKALTDIQSPVDLAKSLCH